MVIIVKIRINICIIVDSLCLLIILISAAYDIQRGDFVATDWVTDALNRNDTDLRQVLAGLGGNDPHSSAVTVPCASMNTLNPYFGATGGT